MCAGVSGSLRSLEPPQAAVSLAQTLSPDRGLSAPHSLTKPTQGASVSAAPAPRRLPGVLRARPARRPARPQARPSGGRTRAEARAQVVRADPPPGCASSPGPSASAPRPPALPAAPPTQGRGPWPGPSVLRTLSAAGVCTCCPSAVFPSGTLIIQAQPKLPGGSLPG